MSRHLRLLLATGLVDDERSVTDARVRLFFLRREPVAVVGEWIERVLAGAPWDDEPNSGLTATER
jgi:DNA-binding transcriptional ArsR family regulator